MLPKKSSSENLSPVQRIVHDFPKEAPVLQPGQYPAPVGYKQIRRRVPIPDVINVASLDGMQLSSMQFQLCCAIEHRGSVDSGHFVTHVKAQNDFFCIDDMLRDITKSSIAKVEESDLFFFKRRDV